MWLKKPDEINWGDLPKIETTFFAQQYLSRAITAGDIGAVRGLRENLKELGFTGEVTKRKEAVEQISRRIESGELFLVHDSMSEPLTPLVRVTEQKDGRKAWEIDSAVPSALRHRLEGIIAGLPNTAASLSKAQTQDNSDSSADTVPLKTVQYSVRIEVDAPAAAPFNKYPLDPDTELEYHLDTDGKDNAKEDVIAPSGSFPFSKKRHRIPVSKVEFDGLKSVFLWGKEYGSAAFVDSHASVAVGRLKLKRSNARVVDLDGDGTRMELVFNAKALMSVVDFIVQEANKNKDDPDLKPIFNDNRLLSEIEDKGCRYWVCAVYGPQRIKEMLTDDADRKWAHKVHKNEGVAGAAQWVWFFGGGEWDYKPIIREIWGARQRLGNSGDIYYYDMWANFHYGFIGRIAGFEMDHLIDGANQAQFVDTREYDPVDDVLTQVGYELGVFTRAALLAEIDTNRQDFMIGARELYWSDQAAAKGYVEREFVKRSIPDPAEHW